MENPYIELFRQLKLESNPVDVMDLINGPKDDDLFSRYIDYFHYRILFTRKYAWAIPDESALEILVAHAPIIEIGAGIGYWAGLMQKRGIEYVAFDQTADYENIGLAYDEKEVYRATQMNYDRNHRWGEVRVGDETEIQNHQDKTLFLCWPPNQDELGLRCLKLYAGKHVIFVGEGSEKSGNHAFHEYLSGHFEMIQTHQIPRYEGVSDCLWVFRRKWFNGKN